MDEPWMRARAASSRQVGVRVGGGLRRVWSRGAVGWKAAQVTQRIVYGKAAVLRTARRGGTPVLVSCVVVRLKYKSEQAPAARSARSKPAS